MHRPLIASMCVDSTDCSQAPPLYRNVTFMSVLSNNIPYTQTCLPRSPISSMSAVGRKLARLAKLNRLVPLQSMSLCWNFQPAKILSYAVYIYFSFLYAWLLILYSDTSQKIMWCLYIPESAASFTTAKIPTSATRDGQSLISWIILTHEPS